MLVFCLSVMIKLFFQLDASICPEKCNCSSKNAIHCSGPHIKDLESLNLPCNMTEIHITGTNVTYLQDVFSRMVELQHLILSSNNISLISPAAFKGLRKLKALKLLENKLKSIKENLHLGSLWLYHTKLSTIPDFVFSNLTNLELLVLSFNPDLSVLPKNVFSGLNELRGLSLHTNNISSLPEGIFLSLQKLQNISLFDKRLEVLPRNLFHNLKHLQKVYLNSTKLQSLPGDFFTASSELQEVFLDNNPWRCDCQILGFREWLLKSMEIVINVPSLTCQSPLALQNISLVALTADHLKCPPTTAITYQMFMFAKSGCKHCILLQHLVCEPRRRAKDHLWSPLRVYYELPALDCPCKVPLPAVMLTLLTWMWHQRREVHIGTWL
uniref:LRRCT domain-containing protein n=1 Tax=Strigops habroptila TaxID=2489341 RepID=A0A672V8Q3_STRHB